MISTSTFAFALALVAVVNGALVWITWLLLTRDTESLRSTMQSNSASVSKRLERAERAAPANLADAVDALSADVGRLRTTVQRLAGRFDQFRSSVEKPNGASETPEQTRARLRTQLPGPKVPGGRDVGEH